MATGTSKVSAPPSPDVWEYGTSECGRDSGFSTHASSSSKQYCGRNSIDTLSMKCFVVRSGGPDLSNTAADRTRDNIRQSTSLEAQDNEDEPTVSSTAAQDDRSSGTEDGFEALRQCIGLAGVSEGDWAKAYTLLHHLSSKRTSDVMDSAIQHHEANSQAKEAMKRVRLLEDRLDSLVACVQTEAKTRASMSALYDHEFSRVGYDMFVTKNKTDAPSTTVEQIAANFTPKQSEQLSAAEQEDDSVKAAVEEAFERKIAILQAIVEEEQRRRAALSELISHLEQPAHSTVQNQLEELRVSITAFDADVDRASARISKLEKDLSDGLNDGGLTASEHQLDALEKTTNHGRIPDQPADRVTKTTLDTELRLTKSRLAKLEQAVGVYLPIDKERLTTLECENKNLKYRHADLAEICAKDWSTQNDTIKRLEQAIEEVPCRPAFTGVDLEDLFGGDLSGRLEVVETRLGVWEVPFGRDPGHERGGFATPGRGR